MFGKFDDLGQKTPKLASTVPITGEGAPKLFVDHGLRSSTGGRLSYGQRQGCRNTIGLSLNQGGYLSE